MRINNSKIKNIVVSVYFIILLVVVVSMIVFRLFREWIQSTTLEFGLYFVLLLIIFIFFHWLAKYFEYDSEGKVLVLINRGLVISDYFKYGEKKVEFPKTKLLYYKLNNYIIYKCLNLYVRSGEKHQKRIKFNVSFVSNKKLKYMKMSLNKILKENKANR